ncbi:MAG TPA: FtsX-like permease family protein [Jatrophihabitans sp.]|nr:FtsX-like permease family protein [Jatrophihabitans sp.]
MAARVMRKVSLRNLAAHKVRLALTVLSVVLGTAFVTGSFVFTDTLGHTFHGLFADVAKGVDVQVRQHDEGGSGVPISDIATIQAVPGVVKVDPQISGQIVLLAADGKPVRSGGAPTEGLAYADPAQRIGDPYRFESGKPPASAGQIALNKGALALAHLGLGDRTKVLVPNHATLEVTVVGVYSTKSDTGGYVGALFSRDQAMQLFTDGSHVDAINVAGAGVSQVQLERRIAAAVPGLTYKTGQQVTKETQNNIDTVLKFINYFLLAFGAIALLVGTFIIYNTFSMIVAQRLRELALLRAIGASRRQVNRSVLFEAVVVGLAGSILGIAAGTGLAYGLRALLNSFQLGLPSGPLQLMPRTIVAALAVGILVTVFSAYAPARRAATTPPVAAMREEFAAAGTSLRRRTAIGAGFAVVAIAALTAGGIMAAGGTAASLVGLGALLMILAVLLVAPALSRPVVRAVGVALAAPFGPIGRLARTNAIRNPRRTAATAFALTLGLMLVSAIAVFGASAKFRINQLVDTSVRADYILTGPDATGVPYQAGAAVAQVSGVQSTVAIYPVQVKLGNHIQRGSAADGPLSALLKFQMISGTDALTGNHLLVSQNSATSHHWTVGSIVDARSLDGKPAPLQVTGIYRTNQLLGDWLASGDYFRKVTPSNRFLDEVILVKARPGADLAALRTALTDATDPYLVVKVQNRAEFKGSQAATIDQLLGILYGLLALAIVIAILGIVNTLALSVVERRREIGMLRAVGMLRAQVRRTIYLESTLIAVFGAVVGLVLGLGFGALFVRTLRDQGLTHVAVPVGQSVLMLVLAAVVGVLAALWPAMRAARTKPLAAITSV